MKREYTIAVCDTQKSDISALESAINSWADKDGSDRVTADTFRDAAALRSKLADGYGADTYIITIPAHGTSGIELARQIRLRQPDVPVIIIAASRTFAYEAYELHAIRYLLGTEDTAELRSALDLAYMLFRVAPADTVSVRLPGETRNISADDVVYIENNVRSMRYILRDGSTLTGTRRNISFESYFAPLLRSGRFVQPHKSFIINIRYIRSLHSNSISMTNGVQIPISRRHISEVQEAYSKFAG